MKTLVLVVTLAIVFASCQKKPSPQPDIGPPAAGAVRPEEPIRRLAWEAVQRIREGGFVALQVEEIRNQAAWPAGAVDYFRTAFLNQLKARGISVIGGDIQLRGTLLRKNGKIVFAFSLIRDQATLLTDSAGIEEEERLQNTLAQFEQPHVHKEMPVPTPLAQLGEEPLDLFPACAKNSCLLTVLYENRLDVMDWQAGTHRSLPIPPRFFARTRSRAPSGKIVRFGEGFIVMHNSLVAPLYFESTLSSLPALFTSKPEWLPLPVPGMNSYSLRDGTFYDFELIENDRFAAVDMQGKLSIAALGQLATSQEKVGGTVSAHLPALYVSSPNPPDQPDAILKFVFQENSLQFVSSKPVDGQILDLLVSDLNLDQQVELLVTVRSSRGIFIEVQEPF